MSFYVRKCLPDYRITVDGWVDLATILPDKWKPPFVLVQRKGTTTLMIAPTESISQPTGDTGIVLSNREKLTIAAPHIWVRGKGALIGISLCDRV